EIKQRRAQRPQVRSRHRYRGSCAVVRNSSSPWNRRACTGCPPVRVCGKCRARYQSRSLLTGTFRLSTISSQLSAALQSLLRGALAQELGDVEIHEVCVMEDD